MMDEDEEMGQEVILGEEEGEEIGGWDVGHRCFKLTIRMTKSLMSPS
jgi:hypothetical protein